MKHFRNNKLAIASLFCLSTLNLVGCGGGSGSSDEQTSIDLPEGLSISMLSNSGQYYSIDTESEALTDLNALATGSQDSSIEKLAISDTSTIGHFFHWPDFREVNGEERFDMKYVLMTPNYQDGDTIDSTQMIQLTHFHDDTLAAHSADEFENPAPGSGKALGLERLNNFVNEQSNLEEEVAEVMDAGTTLCRAYVDPYVKYEMEEEHAEEEDHANEEGSEESEEEHEHAHHDLIHYALDTTGRMYFFAEEEDGLEQTQGFVQLDDVSNITDCSRTTIARVNEDGVLVFVPDSQKFYLVDSHGGDFHQHSTWDVSDILPEGVSADLVAIIGTGEEHDHDHEEDEEHEEDEHDHE